MIEIHDEEIVWDHETQTMKVVQQLCLKVDELAREILWEAYSAGFEAGYDQAFEDEGIDSGPIPPSFEEFLAELIARRSA